MTVARMLGALAGRAARRPLIVVSVALALAAAGAVLALSLRPTAQTSTFVGSSSASYRATQAYYRRFGGEPIQVVVKGDLQRLLLSGDVGRLLGLEGCVAGKVPQSALPQEGGVNGPCGQIARMHAVKVVIGPATFIEEAAEEIDGQLAGRRKSVEAQAAAARRSVRARALAQGLSVAQARTLGREAGEATMKAFAAEVATLAVRYGISEEPSLESHSFITSLVFNTASEAPGTPKARFAYLFPSRDAALISIRLRAGLSEARTEAAIATIRRALAMPQWRLANGRYLLTGEPVIVSQLTSAITRQIILLLVAVAIVMALVLSLVFRGRPRLLPLGLALIGAALLFGALSLAGARLSIGEVAVLPVLTGLAVDYAIQLHSRVQEALGGSRPDWDVRGAVVMAASTGGPSIAAAAAASGGAMLVLLLSPVPLVRSFALLLVAGLAIALLCALTVGSAAIVLAARLRRTAAVQPRAVAPLRRLAAAWRPGRASGPTPGPTPGPMPGPMPGPTPGPTPGQAPGQAPGRAPGPLPPLLRGGRAIAASWRGAQALAQDNPLTRMVAGAALGGGLRRPRLVLVIATVLAAAGWGLSGQVGVQSDLTKLAPQSMSSLRNLSTLEHLSGVGGEVDLMVSGHDLTKPATIEWMSSYERKVLKRFGGEAGGRCGAARLCPAFSLPDIFSGPLEEAEGSAAPARAGGQAVTRSHAGAAAAGRLTAREVNGLLRIIPTYFSEDVISANRRYASLAFGVRLMPLTAQQAMIESMRSMLHPPAGVHVRLVGLPVLAAAASVQVGSAWWRTLTQLAGLIAVALVLLAAFGLQWRRALTPLIPVALASGWSTLVVFVIGIPLNPMSVTLGALVIAICTEFSVLFSERYREELASARREGAGGPEQALERTYRATGAAIAASGVTAIAGFGVLALSSIEMLRGFGLVTLIDLIASLIGVLIVLPAALMLGTGEPRRRAVGWTGGLRGIATGRGRARDGAGA